MITFKRFLLEQNLGNLPGATQGGTGGNWGGSLPKLIQLLPMGSWNASSQKRDRQGTRSGGVSDHWVGNANAYAADFGLNSTFGGNQTAATNFAVAVARNTGAAVTSWQPYVGKDFTYNTQDGFRVQIIWLSNVGGNHYDHVHVGVKAGANASGPGGNPITGQPGAPSPQSAPSDEIGSGSLADAAGALVQGAKGIFSGGMNK